MKIKKLEIYAFGVFLFAGLLALSGCVKQVPNMDQLGENGRYNYQNLNFGFSVELPEEFIYYQTQRTQGEGYEDIEFYVPTSDIAYVQRAFPSYGQPIVVRVYKKKSGEPAVDGSFKKFGENRDYAYAVRFWDEAPSDWKAKWSEEMKKEIEKSLKVR